MIERRPGTLVPILPLDFPRIIGVDLKEAAWEELQKGNMVVLVAGNGNKWVEEVRRGDG